MKVLKMLLAILGVAGLIGGGVYLAWTAIDINAMMAVANANKSEGFPSPINKVYLTVGLAALGALLLGLGLGLPSRTAAGIRRATLTDAATRREGQIASRAVAQPAGERVVVTDTDPRA